MIDPHPSAPSPHPTPRAAPSVAKASGGRSPLRTLRLLRWHYLRVMWAVGTVANYPNLRACALCAERFEALTAERP